MEEIRICDTTMACLRAAGTALSFKEKLELARLLDRIGVSVIELDGITQVRVDSLLIKSVAASVRESAVAVPVALSREGVETVWSALREAVHPRLQVRVPVSTVQMEYLYRKKPDAVIAAIRETTALCRSLTEDVEFIADDATRSDAEHLARAISAAIEAGAGTVTVCDTAGTMLPAEFCAFLESLYAQIPALRGVTLGVACSDAIAMADACAVSAALGGAKEVKATAYPADSVSLPRLVKALEAKGETFGVRTGIRTVELRRVLGQIARMLDDRHGKNGPYSGVGSDAEDTVLSQHDDKSAVLQAVARLGYELSEEDEAAVWDAFARIAVRKEQIGARELDTIVASAAMQVPAAYEVKSYVINTGSVITAMAHLKLIRNGTELEGVALGDGPIDAAFLALEQVTGRRCEMDDFQIRTVTEGHEAMGECVVRLRAGGKLYSGRGISTDIVGASIRAYVNALNRIVYEEGEA